MASPPRPFQVAILAGCGQSDPPPDAAAGTREKPRLFQGAHTWKKVMDDFFHGQLGNRAKPSRRPVAATTVSRPATFPALPIQPPERLDRLHRPLRSAEHRDRLLRREQVVDRHSPGGRHQARSRPSQAPRQPAEASPRSALHCVASSSEQPFQFRSEHEDSHTRTASGFGEGVTASGITRMLPSPGAIMEPPSDAPRGRRIGCRHHALAGRPRRQTL